MAEPYFTELRAQIAQVNAQGNAKTRISVKHFFSGAAAYADGVIFMSLSPVGLALKLTDEDCQTLLGKGAKPLRYFPKAPVKKGYVVLPSHIVDNQIILNDWILRSLKAQA